MGLPACGNFECSAVGYDSDFGKGFFKASTSEMSRKVLADKDSCGLAQWPGLCFAHYFSGETALSGPQGCSLAWIPFGFYETTVTNVYCYYSRVATASFKYRVSTLPHKQFLSLHPVFSLFLTGTEPLPTC